MSAPILDIISINQFEFESIQKILFKYNIKWAEGDPSILFLVNEQNTILNVWDDSTLTWSTVIDDDYPNIDFTTFVTMIEDFIVVSERTDTKLCDYIKDNLEIYTE